MNDGQVKCVVKIGGSLSGNPALKTWLDVLVSNHSKNGVVIVPGGGRFADTVRDAQRRWNFNDALAHVMALHAMEQYGMMMTGINAQLSLARDSDTIHKLIQNDKIPVWMPVDMVACCQDIAHDWSVTSDSLAAWFAGHLQAEALILIKSASLDSASCDIHELSRMGLVDEQFPHLLSGKGFTTCIFNAEQHAMFSSSKVIPYDAGLRVSEYL